MVHKEENFFVWRQISPNISTVDVPCIIIWLLWLAPFHWSHFSTPTVNDIWGVRKLKIDDWNHNPLRIPYFLWQVETRGSNATEYNLHFMIFCTNCNKRQNGVFLQKIVRLPYSCAVRKSQIFFIIEGMGIQIKLIKIWKLEFCTENDGKWLHSQWWRLKQYLRFISCTITVK